MKKNRTIWVQWLILLGAFSLATENQLPAQQPSRIQRLVLANGDRLPVNLLDYQDDVLEFGSPLFYETVSLEAKHVQAIQFDSRGKSDLQEAGFVLRFRDGAQLSGQILELTETQCELDSFAMGKVTIPTEDLLEIRRLKTELTGIEAEGESSSSSQRISAANWSELGQPFRLDTQGWISIRRNTPTTMNRSFKPDSRMGMEFQADDRTSFRWSLILDGRPVHAVNVAKGSIVVESNEELAFAEYPLEQDLGYLAFQLLPSELQIVDVHGQAVVSIPHSEFKSASLELTSESAALKIREFVFQDALPASGLEITDSSNRIAAVQGDLGLIPFEQLSFSEGRFIFVDRSGNAVKSESQKLDRIWFGVSEEPREAKTNNFTMIWENGDRMMASQFGFREGKLWASSDDLASEEVEFALNPAIVCIEKEDRPRVATPDEEQDPNSFGLSMGGVPFRGRYSWGDGRSPIRWQFDGFADPVSLNVNRKIEIRRPRNSAKRLEFTKDRILFHDGTILPCSVTSVSETEVGFESDVTQTRSVELESIKGIFLSHRKIPQALERITKESISRALRVPRFADDVSYAHILLAANGDMLRGRLVRLDQEHIIFESYLQQVKIEREKVLGIVSLGDLAEESIGSSDDEPQGNGNDLGETSGSTVQIDCGKSFKAVGKYVSLDSNSAILESPILGRMEVEETRILQIAFNSPLKNVSVLDSFSSWNFGAAVEPRWTEEVPVAPEANLLLGQMAADFELAVLDGKQDELFRLSDHLGKVVVINFWASHSSPCEMAMPGYLEVINQFSPEDVVFAAISQAEAATKVSRFVKSRKWKGGKFLLDSENVVGQEFAVSAVPHLTIIDKQGKIRYIKVGYSPKATDALREKIESLLSE